MPRLRRNFIRGRIAPLLVCASLLASCGAERLPAVRAVVVDNPQTGPNGRPHQPNGPKKVCGPRCVAWANAVHHAQLVAYLEAVWLASLGLPPDVGTQQIMVCIKSYESGDYTESSHPSSGSGAYQWIPSSWSAWYSRWRDAVAYVGSDYPYAYSAPPLIQDAVTAYALTHGGAGNWSSRFGVDPCTER